MTDIIITSINYEGETANIVFSPDTGGTINIGYVKIPYVFSSDYIYGQYSLYFPTYEKYCYLDINNPITTTTTTT